MTIPSTASPGSIRAMTLELLFNFLAWGKISIEPDEKPLAELLELLDDFDLWVQQLRALGGRQ